MKRIITAIITMSILAGILVITVPSIRVIVVGHTQDLISRTTEGQHVAGPLISSGFFDETSNGRDKTHWANGSVSIIRGLDGKRYVQLEDDFVSGPLPDGHVYVSLHNDINNIEDFDNVAQLELGRLIKGSGASFYEIPDGVIVNSVTILCKQFHVFISSADVSQEFSLEAKITAHEALTKHIRNN